MNARRAPGEGSIYQRKDGRWVAAIRDPVTRRRRTAYAATEKDARRLLRAMTGRADRKEVVLDARAPLDSYAGDWLATRASRGRRPGTVAGYEWRLKNYIYPYLGGKRVGDISPGDVEDTLEALAGRGLGRESVKGARNALAAVLSHAVRSRHLAANPANGVQVPERAAPTKPVVPPTAGQVGRLLDEAAETPLFGLVLLLATTGARIGEALGAKWADIDLETGTWRIARTAALGRDGSVILSDRTKTGRERTVILDADAVEALRVQRRTVAEARLRCPSWRDHDLVFPSSVGTVQDHRNVRPAFTPIARRAGFPGSFHALRHFTASVALSSVPLPVVSKVLGHRHMATTTDTYHHLLESDAGKVTLAVSLAVKSARSAS